jgi:hypothetical protein
MVKGGNEWPQTTGNRWIERLTTTKERDGASQKVIMDWLKTKKEAVDWLKTSVFLPKTQKGGMRCYEYDTQISCIDKN